MEAAPCKLQELHAGFASNHKYLNFFKKNDSLFYNLYLEACSCRMGSCMVEEIDNKVKAEAVKLLDSTCSDELRATAT